MHALIRCDNLYPFLQAMRGLLTRRESIYGRETAIMMCSDTKKDVHITAEIHYNTSRHEQTPRGGGLARVAGQSCLAGPSVALAAPKLRAPAVHRSMVGSHAWRVKLFYAAHFWSTTGRALRRYLSPTRIVPSALASRRLAHRICRKPRQHLGDQSATKKKRFLRAYSPLKFRISRSIAATSMPAKSVCRVFA